MGLGSTQSARIPTNQDKHNMYSVLIQYALPVITEMALCQLVYLRTLIYGCMMLAFIALSLYISNIFLYLSICIYTALMQHFIPFITVIAFWKLVHLKTRP